MANKNFKTDITADGDVSGKNLKATNSAVNEGGQIELSTPSSGTTLSGTNVTIDVYQDKLRFFESGGTNRGAYIPLPSTGSAVGTNLLGGTTGAMNYAQAAATKQSGISSSGVTIVSQSFTTNGYPVQVIVTGDAENSTAGGWVVVQLHRDSTAIGKKVHIEMSAASENVPYALTVIDAPSAGTYTYSLKTVSTVAAGTMNFGETDGPVLTLVELSGPKGDTGAAGSTGDSFKTIAVTGQDSVVADSSTDTLNLVAGTNVSIATNATTDSITINSTGAYTSVDSITYPDYITFDTTPETIPTAAGSLFWDSGDSLPKAILNANVELGIGQEQVALVKNATGSTIAKGKVVYINGAAGQRPTIALSDADTEATSSKTLGITAESISNGAEGFVTTFGVLRGVNTNGLTEGAAVWLSSTAGSYTTTVPAEPAHSVFLGYVVKDHATAGEIFVNIQNGYELTELHGVVIDGTPADNEVLAYDTTSGLWINQTAVEAGLIDTSVTAQTKDGNLTVSGIGSFNNATVTSGAASSSTTTGALKVDGGVGVTGNIYAGGNLVITGNLTVSGDTTTLNTATLDVEDNIITLNSGVAGSPTLNAGVEVNRGTSTDVSLNWNESLDKWTATYDLNGNKEFPITEVSTLQVVNDNGSTITALDPVFISGIDAISGTVFIQKMSNNSEKFLGFTTSSVLDEAKCIVVTRGLISGVDTSSYSAGAVLYISSTGTITATKPSATYIQKIGKVLFSNVSGSIYLFSDETLLPKLTSGYVWLGNGSNEVSETLLNTANVPELTNLYFTDERAQDAINSALVTNATHSGVSVAYVDGSNALNITNTGVTSIATSYTGNVSASDLLTIIKTVDGAGSGLDADTLDGNSSGSFATAGHDHTGVYQPLDADLTAIATLAGTSGFLKKTAADTWSLDTSTYLTTAVTSLTGTANQITASASTGSVLLSLPNAVTMPGSLTVTGNLIVNGTTQTTNSTTVTVDDPIITLGGDTAPASDDNKDRGVEFRWHNGTSAKVGFFGYDDSEEVFTFIPDATNSSEVFSGTPGSIRVDSLETSDATGTISKTDVYRKTGNAAAQDIDTSINETVYTGAEYLVSVKTSTGRYLSKVLLICDGTNPATITEYGILTIGTAPAVTVAASATSVSLPRLSVNAPTDSKITLVRTLVAF